MTTLLLKGMRPLGRILFFTLGFLGLTSCAQEPLTAVIYLTNDSVHTITGVFYGDVGGTDWSANLIAADIQPQELRIVEGFPRDTVEVKIVFGDPDETTNITTRDFTFVNRLNLTMKFP